MTTVQAGTDRPLRVVAYTDAAGIGGAEISLGYLVATASAQFQISVVGVSQTVVEAIAHGRPQADRFILPSRGLQSFAAHLHTLSQLQPDIVHANLCTPWACATGLTAALMLPHARVVRVDQLPLRTTDAIALWRTRAISLRVDAHVAVGKASAQRMEDFYALGRDSVLSIPNGVPDFGEPESPVETNKQLVVGSVGRLDLMKAHEVLLQAISPLEGVKVVILGEGEQRTALEKLAFNLGISDRVSLPGWVDNPRLYLPGFDVIALPSRSEGFPLAIVEAMLAARPVIATRVGSVPEAVWHGETGLLIDKNDVNGLTQAIRQLRDDPALRSQLGRRAREVAIAHFTVEAMTESYENLWKKLMITPQVPRLRVPRPRD
ncbi:glycosyltransferase family 4 protein [Leptolyngbya sp. FACHB-541]|uniref:glycosyltransferase family 4 protein n=1 Tax=Leptolyngbya sp. FACHB-541 TaxID=2692810 RepID=UPI0018EFC4DA|nr:glycosyltransferase family 4 protein [Leptolyngbya sp. FACHB-541]